MQRLLVSEQDLFASAGMPESAWRQLRRTHFACYRAFLKELRFEVRNSRRRDAHVMECSGQWDFQPLLGRLLRSESSLIYLAWLGWKARLGFKVDGELMTCLLDYLLSGGISQPEAVTPL